MQRLSIYSVLFVSLFSFSFLQDDGPADCDPKGLKDKAKAALDPYSYDSGKITKLKHTTKDQVKEIEIPMFVGEKYRLAFNLTALKKNVEINIYNKDKESKNRKLLYSNKDKFEKEFIFEISRMRHVYIDYNVPAGTNGEDIGCAVFALGYK
jgi:hypothetical protein